LAVELLPHRLGRRRAEAHTLSHHRWGIGIVVLLMVLGTVSALKGFNLIVTPTASYLYYTDYRFGFVIRGLVGQIFAPLLDSLPPSAHQGLLIGWHFVVLAGLVGAIAVTAARTVVGAGRVEILPIAILTVTSPLVPSLAYFTAQPDALLCLLTLGIVAAMRAGRPMAASVMLAIGGLAHQLTIFLALPVMVLAGLVHGKHPARVLTASVIVAAAICAMVLAAPVPDERLVARFVENGIPAPHARSLYQQQLGQSLVDSVCMMIGLWREHALAGFIVLGYGTAATAAIAGSLLLHPGAMRTASDALRSLGARSAMPAAARIAVVATAFSPLVVLAFALDLSRLSVLSVFTAFLTADILLRAVEGPEIAPAGLFRIGAALCGALAVGFLFLPMLGLWFTGFHVNVGHPLIPDPLLETGTIRWLVDRLIEFHGAGLY
jgi:hypothetical protein